jgi:hypothetical protein
LGRFAVVPDVEKASAAELELAICHGELLRVPEEAEASEELRGFVTACPQREPTRRAARHGAAAARAPVPHSPRRRGVKARAAGAHRRHSVAAEAENLCNRITEINCVIISL